MFRAEELSLETIGRLVTGREDFRYEAEDRQQLNVRGRAKLDGRED